MKLAYQIFEQNQLQDSPFILCYREIWGRLQAGQSPREHDLRQIQHMVNWLEAKVTEYKQPLPYAEQFQALYDATEQAWTSQLEGVYQLVDFLETSDAGLLDCGLALCEQGESVLRQLQEAILAERESDNLCLGYLD